MNNDITYDTASCQINRLYRFTVLRAARLSNLDT